MSKAMAIGLAVCLGACSSPKRVEESVRRPAREHSGRWLDASPLGPTSELFEREAEPPEQPLVSPDGRFTARAFSGAPGRWEAAPGRAGMVELALAPGERVLCSLHRARLYPADHVRRVAQELRQQVDLRAIAAADLRAIGGHPLLFVDALYTTRDRRARTGEFKLALFAHPQLSVACTHDGAGYRSAFTRTVQRLVETLRDEEVAPATEPRWAQVMSLRLGGELIGFSVTRLFAAAQEGFEQASFTATLVPAGPGVLSTEDVGRVERLSAAAALEVGRYSVSRDGSWTDLDARWRAGGQLAIEGAEDDRLLLANLPSSAPIRATRAFELRDLVEGRRQQIEKKEFSPDRPAEIVSLTLRRDGSAPWRVRADRRTGAGEEVAYSSEVDERGVLVSMRMPFGRRELVAEEIWSSGTPP
jgi:hypothetical protein